MAVAHEQVDRQGLNSLRQPIEKVLVCNAPFQLDLVDYIHRHDVFGTIRQAKAPPGCEATSVASQIQRDDMKSLGERAEAEQPIEPTRRDEAVQEHQRGRARRSLQLADEGRPATGNLEMSPRRRE